MSRGEDFPPCLSSELSLPRISHQTGQGEKAQHRHVEGRLGTRITPPRHVDCDRDRDLDPDRLRLRGRARDHRVSLHAENERKTDFYRDWDHDKNVAYR